MMVKCERCCYWEDTGHGAGLCRRHAPRALLSVRDADDGAVTVWPATSVVTLWPATSVDEWCGDGCEPSPVESMQQ